MRIKSLIVFLFTLLFFYSCIFYGCTRAGSKFLNIQYLGQPKTSGNLNIGISTFLDKRDNAEKGYIGKRILNSGKEEIYYVNGLNVAETITKSCESHLKKNGYQYTKIENWEINTDALKNIDKKFQYVIAGDIKNFEFFADKGYITKTNLDIQVIIYIGNVQNGQLTTIPVNLNLVRKDFKFSLDVVEKFINESLTEVLIKSIKL